MEHEKKIWKVRTVKDYADAHTHILIGQVLEVSESYVRMHCKSYHFTKVVKHENEVQEGCLMVRIVPWHRIEIINELSPQFAYAKAHLTADDEQMVILNDGELSCSLVSQDDRRY